MAYDIVMIRATVAHAGLLVLSSRCQIVFVSILAWYGDYTLQLYFLQIIRLD